MIQMPEFFIKPDDLAYWYLRLNGFLTIHNFIVHHETRAPQRTDVDILGVRFPFRNEINMPDSDCFSKYKTKPLFIFAEATKSRCKLNGPWTDKDKGNMQRVLISLGAFDSDKIDEIANSLYQQGYFENQDYKINLLCIGKDHNSDVEKNYPEVPQILFTEILDFIHKRFRKFHDQKSANQQWDENGKNLWKCYDENRNNIENFKDTILSGIKS